MTRKQWAGIFFAAYGIWMLWLLFGQRFGQSSDAAYWDRVLMNLNLHPLETLRRYLWVLCNSTDRALLRHAVINLGGNVIMFVPLGFFVPCLWEKLRPFGWHFLTMVLIILTIETVQLFTLLGSCDVDDLLLNLVGTTLGWLLWKLWHHLVNNE